MTTSDVDRLLNDWMAAAEPVSEPAALLPSVFAVTRRLPQRRGLTGRLAVALRSGPAVVQWDARPLLTYAILILVLLAMTFAVAFASGMLRPPIPTGWRALEGNPSPGTFISDLAATESGFVAAGATSDFGECNYDPSRGQVWASVDGDKWELQDDPTISAVQPQKLLTWNGRLYLFGQDISCLDPGEETPGGGAWRRSVDGSTWDSLPRSEVYQYGNIPHFAAVPGRLVAAGLFQPAVNGERGLIDETRVWSSTDGETWEYVSSHDGWIIASLAAQDDVLVALGYPDDRPGTVALMRSDDGGRAWEEQPLPDGIPQSLAFLASGGERFVAVGDEVAVTSTDGRTWTAATSDPSALDGVTGLWATPQGFLAVRDGRADGSEARMCTALGGVVAVPVPSMDNGESPPVEVSIQPNPSGPTETCVPTVGGGGTAVSVDGIEWKPGPDLPMSSMGDPHTAYRLATDEHSIVVSDFSHGASVWYSPIGAFRAE